MKIKARTRAMTTPTMTPMMMPVESLVSTADAPVDMG
jgi:hypothetical protein